MGDSYEEAIFDWVALRSTKDVERFLDFANYHRRFITIYLCPALLLHLWVQAYLVGHLNPGSRREYRGLLPGSESMGGHYGPSP